MKANVVSAPQQQRGRRLKLPLTIDARRAAHWCVGNTLPGRPAATAVPEGRAVKVAALPVGPHAPVRFSPTRTANGKTARDAAGEDAGRAGPTGWRERRRPVLYGVPPTRDTDSNLFMTVKTWQHPNG